MKPNIEGYKRLSVNGNFHWEIIVFVSRIQFFNNKRAQFRMTTENSVHRSKKIYNAKN